jgi:intein/homing endonuclease
MMQGSGIVIRDRNVGVIVKPTGDTPLFTTLGNEVTTDGDFDIIIYYDWNLASVEMTVNGVSKTEDLRKQIYGQWRGNRPFTKTHHIGNYVSVVTVGCILDSIGLAL